MALPFDPFLLLVVGVVLFAFFFLYLLVRRTLFSLREGYDDASERR